MKNHYATLGLQEGASQEEIQLAYERLSKQLDPAENNNEEFFIEEFEKVKAAYNALYQSSILRNSDSRTSTRPNNVAPATPSSPLDSFTVTISKEKIEELKNRTVDSEQNPHIKPSMFRNPFSFSGRIRRLEYGLSLIFYYIWTIISALLALFINPDNYEGLYYLILLPGLWFALAQAVKRCHDRGNSGWYQIIPFYIFWMLFADGDIGENAYGSNPKGINRIN